MIPPLIRRCPRCGYVGFTTQFAVVSDDRHRFVECPSCHERFEPFDRPVFN